MIFAVIAFRRRPGDLPADAGDPAGALRDRGGERHVGDLRDVRHVRARDKRPRGGIGGRVHRQGLNAPSHRAVIRKQPVDLILLLRGGLQIGGHRQRADPVLLLGRVDRRRIREEQLGQGGAGRAVRDDRGCREHALLVVADPMLTS